VLRRELLSFFLPQNAWKGRRRQFLASRNPLQERKIGAVSIFRRKLVGNSDGNKAAARANGPLDRDAARVCMVKSAARGRGNCRGRNGCQVVGSSAFRQGYELAGQRLDGRVCNVRMCISRRRGDFKASLWATLSGRQRRRPKDGRQGSRKGAEARSIWWGTEQFAAFLWGWGSDVSVGAMDVRWGKTNRH